MTSSVEDLTRDYRTGLLRYLPRRDEAALHVGYELGRAAVVSGTSLLTVAQVHHQVLLEVLVDSRPEDLPHVATAASEFLVEVLATFDMTQRALRPAETGGRPGAGGDGSRGGGGGGGPSDVDERPPG